MQTFALFKIICNFTPEIQYIIIYLHWKVSSVYLYYFLVQSTQLHSPLSLAGSIKVFTTTNKSEFLIPLFGHPK